MLERRSLLFELVRRDFEQRFVGSAIGWIWGLIHPLVLLTSWYFVFVLCLKMPPPPGVDNYALYIFAGMLPWFLFSDTVQRSASSLLDHANLITKTVFPAEVVSVSVFLSALVSHLMALSLMIAASVIAQSRISVYLILLPIYMLVIGLIAVGLGWIFAGIHVYLRDTAQALSVILTFWFWLTPIFLSEENFPLGSRWARVLLHANPLTYLVRGYRQILIYSTAPDPMDLAIAAAYAIVIFVCGGLFFRHMKRGFADVL